MDNLKVLKNFMVLSKTQRKKVSDELSHLYSGIDYTIAKHIDNADLDLMPVIFLARTAQKLKKKKEKSFNKFLEKELFPPSSRLASQDCMTPYTNKQTITDDVTDLNKTHGGHKKPNKSNKPDIENKQLHTSRITDKHVTYYPSTSTNVSLKPQEVDKEELISKQP